MTESQARKIVNEICERAGIGRVEFTTIDQFLTRGRIWTKTINSQFPLFDHRARMCLQVHNGELTCRLVHTIVSNERMKQERDTRSRILDVAEELFGERGLDRVSIRDITREAKVNLASINYHFGSKEDLIAAVFERRVVPVNEARLAALDVVEKSAGKKIPKLEAILEAFIRPTLQSSLKPSKGGTAFSKLFGRCLSEPSPEVEALLKRQFEPLVERMDAALKKALPHLSRSEIFWRMKFTYGALHHWLLTKDKFRPDWVENVDVETQTQKLISFAAAGFRAA